MMIRLIYVLNTKFSIKYLSILNFFLSIEVTYFSNGDFIITKTKYIRDFLCKTSKSQTKPSFTPMSISTVLFAYLGEPFHDPPY